VDDGEAGEPAVVEGSRPRGRSMDKPAAIKDLASWLSLDLALPG
jgi:hypothetical protein